MSDKYYSYVKDSTKNPYRAIIDEVEAENFDTIDYIYNRGAITSQMIQPIDDLFVLTIPENTLKNADENTYVNELEITKNDEYVKLSDENSEIYDVVLPIPHKVKFKITSSIPLGNNEMFSTRIRYTSATASMSNIEYNAQNLTFSLSEHDENSYVYTATLARICALHELKLLLQDEYVTNFQSATLTITNDRMNYIKVPFSNDFTPELLDYFYDGECLTITSPVTNCVTLDPSTLDIRIIHGSANFSTYNKERKIVFRNLPK